MTGCAAYLNSLSFACTSRAQRVATTQSEHGGSQCHVAPVCQWGDDQTPIVALVLISICEDGQHLWQNE
jgi:hypothetical protein